MLDKLPINNATDATGYLNGPLELRLDERPLFIQSIQATDAQFLNTCLKKAAIELPVGSKRKPDDGIQLRIWPNKYLDINESGQHVLPKGLNATDIGHGQSCLRLRGVNALHFLANYTVADLRSQPIRKAAVLRTKIGHYDALLWWDSTRDIHVLVDRSYAQSFVDYIRALALRHDPADKSL